MKLTDKVRLMNEAQQAFPDRLVVVDPHRDGDRAEVRLTLRILYRLIDLVERECQADADKKQPGQAARTDEQRFTLQCAVENLRSVERNADAAFRIASKIEAMLAGKNGD